MASPPLDMTALGNQIAQELHNITAGTTQDMLDNQQQMVEATQAMSDCVQAMKNHTLSMNQSASSTQKETLSTTLSVCDGIEWKNFRANFEITVQLNNWSKERGILKLRSALRDKAFRAVEHLVFHPDCTIEEALDQMEVVFINPSSTELASSKFEAATREPGETMLEWHIRVRELFTRAHPHEKDLEGNRRLKDRFVLHCRDRQLTMALKWMPNFRTMKFTEALTAAQDYEGTLEATATAYDGGRRRIQQVEDPKGATDEPTTETTLQTEILEMTDRHIQQLSADIHRTDPFQMNRGAPSKGACFHCHKEGHMIRTCKLFSEAVARIKKNPNQFGLAALVRGFQQPQQRGTWGRGRAYSPRPFRGTFNNRGGSRFSFSRGRSYGRARGNRGRGRSGRIFEISEPVAEEGSRDEAPAPYYEGDEDATASENY